MAQLGSGSGSNFPDAIDTRQTYINAPMAAPDSASRVDAEFCNDALHALVQLETTLGARPQGDFASVAARLQQFLPGGGSSPLAAGFAVATSVTIAGTAHGLGTASPLLEVYDNASPRASLEPNTVTVDTTRYDITLTFVTPQSGVVVLANPVPLYSTTFNTGAVAPFQVNILGTTHGLGTALLFASVYTVTGDEQVQRSPASVTVHPGTYDVVITFATVQTGTLTLSAAAPRYSTTFTNQDRVEVFGSTHGLGTPALIYQVYDNATPRAFIEPNSFTVDQSTHTVVMTFATPQSGTLLLVGATTLSGQEFEIRDNGLTNVNAVRVYSEAGTLNLQMGSGNQVLTHNPTGGIIQTTDQAGNLTITGTATKPGGGSWLSPSDARLKREIRPFTEGLDVLVALEPVWYTYNGLGGIRPDGREHVSLLAQAAQRVAPYLIGQQWGTLEHGSPPVELLTLNESPLLYLLLNAVKTLHATVQAQDLRLQAQESSLQGQEVRLLDQETRLARLEAAAVPHEEGTP
jgi:hypothetical protein